MLCSSDQLKQYEGRHKHTHAFIQMHAKPVFLHDKEKKMSQRFSAKKYPLSIKLYAVLKHTHIRSTTSEPMVQMARSARHAL